MIIWLQIADLKLREESLWTLHLLTHLNWLWSERRHMMLMREIWHFFWAFRIPYTFAQVQSRLETTCYLVFSPGGSGNEVTAQIWPKWTYNINHHHLQVSHEFVQVTRSLLNWLNIPQSGSSVRTTRESQTLYVRASLRSLKLDRSWLCWCLDDVFFPGDFKEHFGLPPKNL